jgi:nicotinate-nucleotide--dimethylbenzimidazole phosphoribosyltransferase
MTDRDPGYPAEQRDAVYRVIAERRDVRRGFRPDPVPADVLGRVLAAAHQAPSVGFSQPWDFIVITDRARRERIAALAARRREEFAADLPGARARAFDALKVESILDTPVNIVVSCDRTRGGRHTLGRRTRGFLQRACGGEPVAGGPRGRTRGRLGQLLRLP